MASTYSNIKIQLMATGENATTWGDVTNTNLGTAIEEAIVGSADVTFASGNVTLTLTDTNSSQTARNMRLNLTGTTGGSTRNLVVPSIEKPYIVNNGCANSVVVKTAAGTGVTVPAGKTMWVYCNGTNVVDVVTHLSSVTLDTPLAVAYGGTGNNTGSGAALTNLNASSISSGTLAVSYGGTGASTNSTARVNLLPAYSGNAGKVLALNAGGTDTEWVSAGGAGTVTSVAASGGSTGLTFSGSPITSAGTLSLSGTLGVANGGTGRTDTPTSGQLLVGNGTGFTLATITAGSGITVTNGAGTITIAASGGGGSGTVTSVSGGTTGLTFSNATTTPTMAGTLAVANGGTGQTTYTNGQLLIGNTTGGTLTKATLTAGSGISITNGGGSITIAATGGGGSGTFSLDAGTSSSPSLYFTVDTNTGLYRKGPDAIGFAAGGQCVGWLQYGTSFRSQVVLGSGAGLFLASTASYSVLIGQEAGSALTTNGGSTFVGAAAGYLATGANNTLIGSSAGGNITTGTNNICVGALTSSSTDTVSNEVTLGNTTISALRCQVTTITSISDARDKTDIVPLDAGLDFVNALEPVRFTWNMRDGAKVGQVDTGFLAQDLLAAQSAIGVSIPGLVYESNPDKLEAGYGKLLPVLVKAIQELSAEVEALKARLEG